MKTISVLLLLLEIFALFAFLGCLSANAQENLASDWPGFRGSANGVGRKLPQIDRSNPVFNLVWKVETKGGFGSFCVAGKIAYTIVNRGDDSSTYQFQHLVAFDVTTGKELWSTPLDREKVSPRNDVLRTPESAGPRSTPIVDGRFVYVINSKLTVHAFNASHGKAEWENEFSGKIINFPAASPVIVGDVIIAHRGASGRHTFITSQGEFIQHLDGGPIMGIDKFRGEEVWRCPSWGMTQSTPIVANIHEVPQCIFMTDKGVVSIFPKDGRKLWEIEWGHDDAGASPVCWEDIVYFSSMRIGSAAHRIKRNGNTFSTELLWQRANSFIDSGGGPRVNQWSTPVCKDGNLFGIFGNYVNKQFDLVCIDIKTGRELWTKANFGPAQFILSADKIIAVTAGGEVVLMEANPTGFVEIGREKLLKGASWTYPCLAYGLLFIRSDVEGGCWEIK